MPRPSSRPGSEALPLGALQAVVASDILLYVKAYPALVASLQALCADGAPFFMSWQRRLKESSQFFELLEAAGFSSTHLGRLIYDIRLVRPAAAAPAADARRGLDGPID